MHIAITGASSGIGAALTRAFGTADNKLSLVARRLELLEQLADEVAAEASCHRVDLGLLESCCDWVEAAEQAHGPIDVLINNAGVQYVVHALELEDERRELMMRINLLAPQRLIYRVAPGMVERGSGTIVNVSSMAGITPTPWMADYSASKAGLAAASETLRVELRKTGVNVLTVYPGPVSTPMETDARKQFVDSVLVDNVPTGTVDALARLVRKAVRKRKARIVYPRIYGLGRYFRVTGQWVTDCLSPPLRDKGTPDPS